MERALFSEDGFDVAPDEWSDEGFIGFIGQRVVISRSRNVFMRIKKAEAARILRMLTVLDLPVIFGEHVW